MLTRRSFLKAGLLTGVAGATAAVGGSSFTTESLDITRFDVKSHKIPAAFERYKIAFISDLHCGIFLSENLLKKTIEELNREEVDLLLLGGDYIGVPDSEFARFFSYIRTSKYWVKRTKDLVSGIFHGFGKAIREVKTKDGIVGVLGNHDHWNDGAICRSILPEYGIKLLVNEELKISRKEETISIYGTDDFWTGIPRVSGNFLKELTSFRIFLSHNPDYISNTLRTKGLCFDLALAGHTHGGQICLPGIGPLGGYGVKDRKFFTGTKDVGGGLVHTSRGIGVVDIPYRLNSAPEIGIFTLLRG